MGASLVGGRVRIDSVSHIDTKAMLEQVSSAFRGAVRGRWHSFRLNHLLNGRMGFYPSPYGCHRRSCCAFCRSFFSSLRWRYLKVAGINSIVSEPPSSTNTAAASAMAADSGTIEPPVCKPSVDASCPDGPYGHSEVDQVVGNPVPAKNPSIPVDLAKAVYHRAKLPRPRTGAMLRCLLPYI